MTHSLFYLFAVLLSVGRIYQHACTFHWLVNYKLRFLNNLCDGFSVCIGISQVIVIAEIVYAMQLFKIEMDEVGSEALDHHTEKESKVRRTQATGLVCIGLTITELIVRAFVHDYVIGHAIFVVELLLVGVFMLYFTMQFTALVTEVQQRLGISFMDEKNQLRCSLGVFLFTYFLRSLLKGLTIVCSQIWGDVWQQPLVGYAMSCFVQILYDVLPLLIISHQHHTAFKQEERVQTNTTGEFNREFTQLRPMSD